MTEPYSPAFHLTSAEISISLMSVSCYLSFSVCLSCRPISLCLVLWDFDGVVRTTSYELVKCIESPLLSE